MATEKIKIKLQGHEKFALREGWINKALQILPENPDAFTRRDATDLFGIGSNMVKSLRYWMRAFGLTNNAGTELSETGRLITQYDPYLEDSFTLWIMHSYIAKNEEFATTWFMYFNRCDAEELEKSEVVTILSREIKKYVNGGSFSEKSLSNDVDVLLNMYSRNKEKLNPEDKNISPFSHLLIIFIKIFNNISWIKFSYWINHIQSCSSIYPNITSSIQPIKIIICHNTRKVINFYNSFFSKQNFLYRNSFISNQSK